MDLKLAGKTALITGGSKGIGRATAEIFAAEGCNVIIVSRSADALAAAKSAITQKSNVRVDTVAADLSDSKNVDRLAREFPGIDILVNNAGAIPGGSLLNVDEATWRKAWDLKVFGYVNMCRAFYALMKARGSGVIVNVVGNAADTHDPDYICGVAGNAAQRGDHLVHADVEPGNVDRACVREAGRRRLVADDQVRDHRARRRHPHLRIRRDGADRVHAGERLADDAARERRRGLVRFPRPHGDRRQPQAAPVDIALARHVVDQEFADCLLRSV